VGTAGCDAGGRSGTRCSRLRSWLHERAAQLCAPLPAWNANYEKVIIERAALKIEKN